MATDTRAKIEAELHDKFYNQRTRRKISKYYSLTQKSRGVYQNLLFSECHGKRILEIGCGQGELCLLLAKHGASQVVGIDISKKAIQEATSKAVKEGLADRITFRVMDAELMDFPDNSFDVACGTGILHHLDLEIAFKELVRVLTPEGKGFFMEPMGHNPMINLYRKLTPGLRTPYEHPLLKKDLKLASQYFDKVDTLFFHMFSLLSIPFHGTRVFDKLVRALETFDEVVFKYIPVLRPMAWVVVMSLCAPKKLRSQIEY